METDFLSNNASVIKFSLRSRWRYVTEQQGTIQLFSVAKYPKMDMLMTANS